MKKNRKKVKLYKLDKIEFLPQDKVEILQFINSFKSEKVVLQKKQSIKKRDAIKLLKSIGFKTDEMCEQIKKPVSAGRMAQIRIMFYNYWCAKKAFPSFDLFKPEIEAKLDELMQAVASFEAAELKKMRDLLDNPECASIKSFLNRFSSYNAFFYSGIASAVNIKEYSYSLNVINSALSHRFDIESKRQTQRRMFYIHVGKTNSGKTYNAIQMLKKAEQGAYLSPLRLLALEVSDLLNSEGVPCSFVTGEEERHVENATHISSTVELADFSKEYDVAVIDECQMIADNSRGYAWTKAIMGMRAREICLCTAPEALDVLIKLIDACGDFYEVINHRRKTPLVVEETPFTFDDIQPGDALVAFSKQKVNAIGAQLLERGINVSVLYGALPYETRKQQFENFISGKSTVLVTTDAIGMGVNLPVRRIIFMEIYKFDGVTNRMLTSGEIKQIAGRAGRRGKFDTGFVTANGRNELAFIKKNLDCITRKVEGICIGFPKKALEDKYISLNNAVKAWEYYAVPDIYVKENLQEAMTNISMVRRLYKQLDLEENKVEIFEIATMPVDSHNLRVKKLWSDYIIQKLSANTTLRKPYLRDNSVDEVLTYSKMLDTYFMCGRIWGMEIDVEWIMKQRKICTEKLISGLIDDVGSYTRYCQNCGKMLEWNNKEIYCEACAQL